MINDKVKEKNYKLTIRACYLVQMTVAILLNMTPILFTCLQGLYRLTSANLGILVLITFLVNVAVNFAFSKAADKIGFRPLMIMGALFGAFGFIAFSVSPFIFSNVFLGLIISTVIFSVGSGIFQLLISPIINSLPSNEKSGSLVKLHSFYAWGAIFTVLFTTLILELIKNTLGAEYWYIIPLVLSSASFICLVLFIFAPLAPPIVEEKKAMKNTVLTPFFIVACLAILAGGATEVIISQWGSTYIEKVLQFEKIWGDILGVCLFALMLGLGRIVYTKFSKKINLSKIMLSGCALALVCYLIIALSPYAILSLIAFGFCGLAVSLLWPGILSLTSKRFPAAGAWLFAILTAMGSIGSGIGPYIIGQIGDSAASGAGVQNLALSLGLSPLELGLRIAVLACAVFPILAFFAIFYLHRKKKKPLVDLVKPLESGMEDN